jgi:hypothetical protein
MMVIASGLGLGFSVSLILGSVDLAAALQTQLVTAPVTPFLGLGEPFHSLTVSAVQSGAWTAVLLTPFVYGLVGLLYWSRQLSRTPAFAKLWESEVYDLPRPKQLPPLATRPRGGLLLINVMLLATSVYAWHSVSDGPSFVLQAGFAVVWYVLLFVLVRSVRSSFRGDPQDLEEDGDLVFLAVLGQAVSIGLAAGIRNGTISNVISTYSDDLVLVIAVVVVVLFALVGGLAYLWQLPEQLVEHSREEQLEPDENSDYWLLGYIAGFFLFYVAGILGLADPLDVGLYLVVLVYVGTMWHIDTNVLPERESEM